MPTNWKTANCQGSGNGGNGKQGQMEAEAEAATILAHGNFR